MSRDKVSFTLDSHLMKGLRNIAKRTGMSQARLVEEALKRVFKLQNSDDLIKEELEAWTKEEERQASGEPLYEWECEE